MLPQSPATLPCVLQLIQAKTKKRSTVCIIVSLWEDLYVHIRPVEAPQKFGNAESIYMYGRHPVFWCQMTAQIYFDSFIIYFHVQYTKFHEQ